MELNLKTLVESLLFAAARPLGVQEILEILEAAPERIPGRKGEIEEALQELMAEWEGRGGGIRLVEIAGGFQFRTIPSLAPWISLLAPTKVRRLSTPGVETLALVAYRQPITRAEIESVRGVDSGAVLKGLLERHLIRVVGRKEEPGRPLLYATSREFLELFGLRELGDLPPLAELEEKVRSLPRGEGSPLDLSDLVSSPVDLSNLEEGDREVLGGLEESLKHLKEVEEQVKGDPSEELDKEPVSS